MAAERSLEAYERHLDRCDMLRSTGDYDAASQAAQDAMEALPADGSLDREERAELQQVAWMKRLNTGNARTLNEAARNSRP